MDGGQLERLVTQLGQFEQTDDTAVRLKAASAELARRQAADRKLQGGPTLKQQRQKVAPIDFAGNKVKVPGLTYIRQQGGISLRSKVTGEFHAGGSEIADTIDDLRRSGGLINEKSGITPEDMYDRLVEEGYFLAETVDFNGFLEWFHKEWANREKTKQQTVSDEELLERESFPREILQMSPAELTDLDRELGDALKTQGQDKAQVAWLSEQRSLVRKEQARRTQALKEETERYEDRARELQNTIKSLEEAPSGEAPRQEAVRLARRDVAEKELAVEGVNLAKFQAKLENNHEVQEKLLEEEFEAGGNLDAANYALEELQKVQAEPADIESLYQKAAVALRQGHDIDNPVAAVVDSIVGADPKLRSQLLSLLQQRNLITWEDERFAKKPQPHYVRVQDPRLTPEEEPLSPALKQVVDSTYPDIAAQQGAATSPMKVASAALKPFSLSQADMLAARRVIMDRLSRAGLTYIEKGGQSVWVKPAVVEERTEVGDDIPPDDIEAGPEEYEAARRYLERRIAEEQAKVNAPQGRRTFSGEVGQGEGAYVRRHQQVLDRLLEGKKKLERGELDPSLREAVREAPEGRVTPQAAPEERLTPLEQKEASRLARERTSAPLDAAAQTELNETLDDPDLLKGATLVRADQALQNLANLLNEEEDGDIPLSPVAWGQLTVQEITAAVEAAVQEKAELKSSFPYSQEDANKIMSKMWLRVRDGKGKRPVRLYINMHTMATLMGLTDGIPRKPNQLAMGLMMTEANLERVLGNIPRVTGLNAESAARLHELGRAIREALRLAEAKGQYSVAVVDLSFAAKLKGKMANVFRMLRATVRHEGVHAWQAKYAENMRSAGGGNIRVLSNDDILRDPLYWDIEKGVRHAFRHTTGYHSYLQRPDTIMGEAMAYILSGDTDKLNISDKVAAQWIESTFSKIAEVHGEEALDDLVAMVPFTRKAVMHARRGQRQQRAFAFHERTGRTAEGIQKPGRGRRGRPAQYEEGGRRLPEGESTERQQGRERGAAEGAQAEVSPPSPKPPKPPTPAELKELRQRQMVWNLTQLGVGLVEVGIRRFPEWSAAMIKKGEDLGLRNMGWFRAQLFPLYRSVMAYPGLYEKLQEESDKRLRQIEDLRTEVDRGKHGLAGEDAAVERLRARVRTVEASIARAPSSETLAGPARLAPVLMRRHLERDLKIAKEALEAQLANRDPVTHMAQRVADTERRLGHIEESLEKLAEPEAQAPAVKAPDPEVDARRVERALQQGRETVWRETRREATPEQLAKYMDSFGFDYNSETGQYSVRREAPRGEQFGPPSSVFRRVVLEREAEKLRGDLEQYELELNKAKARKPGAPMGGLEGVLAELEANHEQKLAEGFTPLREAEALALKWHQRGLYEGQVRTEEVHAQILKRFEAERQKRKEEHAELVQSYLATQKQRKAAAERAEQAEAFAPGKKAYIEERRAWEQKLKEVQKRGITEEQFRRSFPPPEVPPGLDVATGKVEAETHIGLIPIRKPEESDESYAQRKAAFARQDEAYVQMVAEGKRRHKEYGVVIESGENKGKTQIKKATPSQLTTAPGQEGLIKAGIINRLHTERMSEASRRGLLGQKQVYTEEGKKTQIPIGTPFAPVGWTIEQQAANLREAYGLVDWDPAVLDRTEALIKAGKMEQVVDEEVDAQAEAKLEGAKRQREAAKREAALKREAAGEEVAEEEDEEIEEEELTEEEEEEKDAETLQREEAEELEKKLGTSRAEVTNAERYAHMRAKRQWIKDVNAWEARRDAFVASEERTEEEAEKVAAQYAKYVEAKPVRPRLRTLPPLSTGGTALSEKHPKIVALNSLMQEYTGYIRQLARALEAVKKHGEKAAKDSDNAPTTQLRDLYKEVWRRHRAQEGEINDFMKMFAKSIGAFQDQKYLLQGYNIKRGSNSLKSILRNLDVEGVATKEVEDLQEMQYAFAQDVGQAGLGVNVETEEAAEGTTRREYAKTKEEERADRVRREREARLAGEDEGLFGRRFVKSAQQQDLVRRGVTVTKQEALRELNETISLSAEEMRNIGVSQAAKEQRAREKFAEETGADVKRKGLGGRAREEEAARKQLAEMGFQKKDTKAQPTGAEAFGSLFRNVSDDDIQKVRRLTRERAMNAPVTRVFERAEWGDDIVNIGAASIEEVLAAADMQSTPELEMLGSYVAQANNAGIAVVELALQDLGYMDPDADGLAIPLKAVPKLAAALRNYGEAGNYLARYMEAVVELKAKGHEVYGDRVVIVNAADHIDSQHLYDNVSHELFHLLQFDMAAELDPKGLNRGKFVVKDPDYPVLFQAMKALGENTSAANIEIEAAGYIASGDWKAMGFQSADHAKAYLKRYIRHLARTYGLQKLAKWPLMAVKGNTIAQAIREVQNEAKGAAKARQKRQETRTAAEEARVQAAAELGIELGEGARGGEGDQSGSRRVVRQLTKEQRKERYEKRRAELAKLTPAERQARRERAAELREEAKEWRESLTPEERKAAWLERRNLIKNMTPEERADYDEAREERRRTNRELARERKGWAQEEKNKENQRLHEEMVERNARREAEQIARNMERFGTPNDPTKPPPSASTHNPPPLLNDPKLRPEFQPINNTEKRWWWRMAAHLWPEMGKDPMVRNGDMSALDMDEAGKGGQGGLGVGAVVDPRAGGKGWRKFAQIRQTILLASLQFWEANVGTAFTSSVYELGRAFTAELLDRMFFSKGDVTRQVVARIRPSDMWKGAIETRRMFTEAKKVGKLYTGPKRGAAARAQGQLPGIGDDSPAFQMEGIPEQLVADFEELQSNWNVNTNARRQPGETRRAWLKRRMEQAVDPGQAVKLNPAATRMEWSNVGNYLFEELLRKANQVPDIYGYSIHFLAHTAALTRLLEQKVAVRTERGLKEAEQKAGRKLTAADPEYQDVLQAYKMQDWEMTEILDQAGAVALDNSMRGRNYPALALKNFRTAIAGAFEGMVRPNAKAPFSDVLRRATNAADYVGNLSFWRIPAGMVHKAGKMVFPFSMINIGTMYWKWQWAEKKNDQQKGRYKAQFIDAISDTVMGSGAIGGIAFTLGFLGMVSGGAKDWEEEEAMKAQGIIPFAFNLNSFGRVHRIFTGGGLKAVRHVPGDVYWRPQKYAAPIALAFDMFVGGGAALQKFADGKPQSWIDWLTAVSWQPTKAMAATLQEMTVLDRAGSDILRAASHAKTTGEWAGAIAKGVAVQAVGSATVPSQIGHMKRLFDKYEREGRGENVFEDMIGKARAKFPGESHRMPVKRDVYGQEIETEPGMPWWTRFILGNFSRYKGNPIIEAGLEAGKIPGRVHQKKGELGQPGETMTETRERGAARGQRIFNAGSVIAETERFKALRKADQDYILAEIYDRAGDPNQAVNIDAMIKSLRAAEKRGPGKKQSFVGF